MPSHLFYPEGSTLSSLCSSTSTVKLVCVLSINTLSQSCSSLENKRATSAFTFWLWVKTCFQCMDIRFRWVRLTERQCKRNLEPSIVSYFWKKEEYQCRFKPYGICLYAYLMQHSLTQQAVVVQGPTCWFKLRIGVWWFQMWDNILINGRYGTPGYPNVTLQTIFSKYIPVRIMMCGGALFLFHLIKEDG